MKEGNRGTAAGLNGFQDAVRLRRTSEARLRGSRLDIQGFWHFRVAREYFEIEIAFSNFFLVIFYLRSTLGRYVCMYVFICF